MTPWVRALIVSYAFPPVGGAGVQRVSKLTKYLPFHGVTPAVLTVKNPSVPLTDRSLEQDIPGGIDILRAPTLEPGYGLKQAAWNTAAAKSSGLAVRAKKWLLRFGRKLLAPDPQVLWLPGSAIALIRRLRSDAADDVIFISGPPFSQFLLAPLSRLRPGTALVLDYRDEWTTQGSYELGSAGAGAWLEPAMLRFAHVITTATEEFRSALLGRFAFLDPARVFAIPNGYDPDDFPIGPSRPPSDHFVLTYVGTVFHLTSARGFIAGLRQLQARNPELARGLEVRFIGRVVETEQVYFEGTEELGVRRQGYLEHREALAALQASHATLCLLDDVVGTDRIYPAKIFELMYLQKPCLAITPTGALSRLVQLHGLGEVVHPADTEGIVNALARLLRAFRLDGVATQSQSLLPTLGINQFHRKAQAGQFAEVFRTAIALARAKPPQATAAQAAPSGNGRSALEKLSQ